MTDKNLSQGTELDAATKRRQSEPPALKSPADKPKSGDSAVDPPMPQSFKSSVRVDLDYAIKQLREFKDITRALDALERIKNHVDSWESGTFPP